MVPEEQVEDARALLALPAPEAAEPEPLYDCPACGSAEIAKLYSWWSFVPYYFTGVPFPLARLRRRCRACGHRWRVPVFFKKKTMV